MARAQATARTTDLLMALEAGRDTIAGLGLADDLAIRSRLEADAAVRRSLTPGQAVTGIGLGAALISGLPRPVGRGGGATLSGRAVRRLWISIRAFSG